MPAAPTWNLKYVIQYTNENSETCIIQLKGKTATGPVEYLEPDETPLEFSSPNSDEDKFTPIRGREATIRFSVRDIDTVNLATFIGADDEWLVVYFKADLTVSTWQGYLVQDEHTREMQDPPYVMELKAVDGLGWLKDKALIRPDGTNYKAKNFTIDYVGDILWLLNCNLKLVTHVNVFHIAMDDRNISPEKDPWQQTQMEARSFLKDAITFEDQYSVLEKILTAWGCVLFQWYGAWHVVDLWDYIRGMTSFTSYSYNLADPVNANVRVVDGGTINKVYEAKIAPANSTAFSGPVYPAHEDQLLGLKFAARSVQLTYNYTPWPELPLNNKFERGTVFVPYSGVGHTAYIPDDWEHGKEDIATGLPFPLAATSKIAYSLRTYDSFGIETKRELIIETPSGYGVSQEDWFRSEGIPVTVNDKISISFNWKTSPNWPDINTPIPARVYVVNNAGTTYYGLEEKPSVDSHGKWKLNDFAGIYAENPGGDWTEYLDFGSESQPIPVTGTLFVVLIGQRSSNTSLLQYFSDFTFTYMPFVAGGYVQVRGDYNLVGQNKELKQKTEVEIFVSDSSHGVLKGAIYRFSNVDGWILSEPQWYRLGITETRRFGEIQALKRFWHSYRAMQKIEGTFSGLIFFDITELPLGMVALLYPEYMGENKRYMITSIDENHKTAEWKATMIESGIEADDSATVDTNVYKFIFE
jgi:hypothetical protein